MFPENSRSSPEKQLNGFVRVVAIMESVGNALGTLAFTWATVVLLGGYPTSLRPHGDFWYATVLVFLEAARMFSRKNKQDYQLFFHTRGAFRPFGCNGLIVMVCFSNVLAHLIISSKYHLAALAYLLMIVLYVSLRRFLSPRALKLLPEPLRHAISLWSPLVAVLSLAPFPYWYGYNSEVELTFRYTVVLKWTAFLLLLVAVLLLTISRLRYQVIIRIADSILGSKQVFWRQVILNLCMFAALVMLVFMLDDSKMRFVMIVNEVYALVVVSIGNLQFPAAVLRVEISLVRLAFHKDYGYDEHPGKKNLGDNTNLTPSMNIFYSMVLGQGILYTLACILQIFSFIPRRSLVHRGGFRGQLGVESVDLYYEYAFSKCMGGNVLAPKKINLITFAVDFLNSDSSKNQLYGIWMAHSLLQKEQTKTRLLSKFTTSTKTMARLINMLDWTNPSHAKIRFLAAKVMVEVAKNFRVVTIPGTVQIVSGLLEYSHQKKPGNPLLDADVEQEEIHGLISSAGNSEAETHGVVHVNLQDEQTRSTEQVGTAKQSSWTVRSWERMLDYWSTPKDEPATNQDLLQALGMSIIYNLAGCGEGNCQEIIKEYGLVPKIIGFTRCEITCTDTQQNILMKSSLKVLHKLTNIEGIIGVKLRHKISNHHLLLRNLTRILGDSRSSHEQCLLVAGILRNLAVDGNTRLEIGQIQGIISKLIQAFLGPDEPPMANADHLLRKAAGQALAMLAMECVTNCVVMVQEAEHVLIKKLTRMIHDDSYRCVAASLLRNMCLHAQCELKDSDLKELSYSVQQVLERIMDAEEAELEILIGLSSQMCKVIPDDFTQQLQPDQNTERFVKRLVDVLNANMEPRAHCPGIRRMTLEQAINMMEYEPSYAIWFNKCSMMEALSKVEETTSKTENYIIFWGDAGLMEYSKPLSSIVVRAKQLLVPSHRDLR
ncbi:hypothetical protein EJB05_01909, partial [Eragrostis curvula]